MLIHLTKEQAEKNGLQEGQAVEIEEGLFKHSLDSMLKFYNIVVKDQLKSTPAFLEDIRTIIPKAFKITFFLYSYVDEAVFLVQEPRRILKVIFDKKCINKNGSPFHIVGEMETYCLD